MNKVTGLSLLGYGGISAVLAGVFLLVTSLGDYPAVARYGGTAWVFLLANIVLMPLVIPWVKRRLGA